MRWFCVIVVFVILARSFGTIIIVEDAKACFRRVLAGKRVSQRYVKRALLCETVEECQRECSEEKQFTCEGFNYSILPPDDPGEVLNFPNLPKSKVNLYNNRNILSQPSTLRELSNVSLKSLSQSINSQVILQLLDPNGQRKGDCELLDCPLTLLDLRRDVYADSKYDYYERDRNAHCSSGGRIPIGYGYGGDYYHSSQGISHEGYGDSYPNRRYDYKDDRRQYDYDRRPSNHDRRPIDQGLRRPGERWPEDDYRKPYLAIPDRRHDYGGSRKPVYGYDYDYEYDNRNGNRRGDHPYHSHHSQQHQYSQNDNYDDTKHDYIFYEPYLPPRYHKKPFEHDGDYWGINNYRYGSTSNYFNSHFSDSQKPYQNNYYLPPKADTSKDWGLYGGSYGNGYHYQNYGNKQGYNYWGFEKYKNKYGNTRPIDDSYLPGTKPYYGYLPEPVAELPNKLHTYLPLPKPSEYDYLPLTIPGGKPILSNEVYNDNSILPAEPRRPPTFNYNYKNDECSLRTAAGFRLHRSVVKKLFSVENIYDCELLCFREANFLCSSYAFRYSKNSVPPADNCFLSGKNYKNLDYYIDLEPDRDFDIYTMNNRDRCDVPVIIRKEYSECFWRVRSGHRLDHKIVKDSLTTKSIVECQIECLKSVRFTCRAFSFRYGSPVIGGSIDNCQLTDCPFYELDPRIHFVPEPGFEIYERGSFGHGCEQNHFGIRGYIKQKVEKEDQLCYVGFGKPAVLLPQAIKKEVYVNSELDCKTECSKARLTTLFQCMSFSFSTDSSKSSPNCRLSDILQRDLLPNIDYKSDPDSWLFAWDNYKPECSNIANLPINTHIDHNTHSVDRYDVLYPLDTWRLYSVNGWPCRKGTLCEQNSETGFWFCKLEGGDKNSWDYCCRPDHQCGASYGYPYQWCYVGPARSQWRKCNDKYYPYIANIIDERLDRGPPYAPLSSSQLELPDFRPGVRPDRPSTYPLEPPLRPSLNEYERKFDEEFLSPPMKGEYGQSRHWPLSYLHKEMPPNTTDMDAPMMRMKKEENPKYAAIERLINVIKNNELKNIEYHISNDSNKEDDILFVKIPLPSNFTQDSKSEIRSKIRFTNNTNSTLVPNNTQLTNMHVKRSQKSLPLYRIDSFHHEELRDEFTRPSRNSNFRRGFITRTNVTSHRRNI